MPIPSKERLDPSEEEFKEIVEDEFSVCIFEPENLGTLTRRGGGGSSSSSSSGSATDSQ